MTVVILLRAITDSKSLPSQVHAGSAGQHRWCNPGTGARSGDIWSVAARGAAGKMFTMPDRKLTDDEIESIVAYPHTL